MELKLQLLVILKFIHLILQEHLLFLMQVILQDQQLLTYLVVAGGGGGGGAGGPSNGTAGGGGAGGYRESFPNPATGGLPVSVQAYPITVRRW